MKLSKKRSLRKIIVWDFSCRKQISKEIWSNWSFDLWKFSLKWLMIRIIIHGVIFTLNLSKLKSDNFPIN